MVADLVCVFILCFKQMTASEMRISDWSSDVCSSDLDLAVALEADRLEIAHVQYYGWAYRNRAALMPTREQVAAAVATVEAARERLRGVLVIDHEIGRASSKERVCQYV